MGVSHHVSVLNISAVFKKLFHHLHMPLFGCRDQGRPAVLWDKCRSASHYGNCKVGHCCHGNSGESRQCMKCSKGVCVYVHVLHAFIERFNKGGKVFLTQCYVNVYLPHHPGWHWHLFWWALGQSPNCPALPPTWEESVHSERDIQTVRLQALGLDYSITPSSELCLLYLLNKVRTFTFF